MEAIHSRVEELGRDKSKRESFDCATSRAVANLSTLAEYLIPLVKPKGICISMKGPNIDEEMQQSKKSVSLLGGKIEKIEKFQLPKIIIRKMSHTPARFPRKSGMPAKEPIN